MKKTWLMAALLGLGGIAFAACEEGAEEGVYEEEGIGGAGIGEGEGLYEEEGVYEGGGVFEEEQGIYEEEEGL